MARMIGLTGCLAAVVLTAVGCGRQTPPEAPTVTKDVPPQQAQQQQSEQSDYLLSAEPEGVVDVITARESAGNDDPVVVVGRIGGDANPWVEGRAAFSIVDPSLKACSDIPGDGCPVPWDYCCETDRLPASKALVKIVDETGNLVGTDARELLHVKELETVVVRGKAVRDDSGNLTVLATGVFVRK